ncbi:MAG: hypothetical protein KAR45_21060, partial [Desulfobacteraceae bacterium]|nr:hypothetical protein [Desulfobacteraceae bacterium]
MSVNNNISEAMRIKLENIFKTLPSEKKFVKDMRRAPKRHSELSHEDRRLALKNALRYVPEKW